LTEVCELIERNLAVAEGGDQWPIDDLQDGKEAEVSNDTPD
jgi:hypothetical protein